MKKNIMNSFILKAALLFWMLSGIWNVTACRGQVYEVVADSVTPPYSRIERIKVSEPRYNLPKGKGSAYRLVITRGEIRNHLFVEKLLLNSEGVPERVVCVSFITSTLYNKLHIHPEQRTIKKAKWQDPDTFMIRIGKRNYIVDGNACDGSYQVKAGTTE
jgi:hypothetical protein